MNNDENIPKFPLRLIFEDGEFETIESPEEIGEKLLSVDSTDPGNGVWVRDDLDRTVLLRVSHGDVERFELAP